MILNKDLSAIKLTPEIPEGWSAGKIKDSQIVKSENGDMLQWKVKVGTVTIKDHMALNTEKGMTRLKHLAVALNHPTPDFIANSSFFHEKNIMVNIALKEDSKYIITDYKQTT